MSDLLLSQIVVRSLFVWRSGGLDLRIRKHVRSGELRNRGCSECSGSRAKLLLL